jgi:glutathione S-transferase
VDSVSTWNVANRFVTRAAGTVAMSLANGKIKKKYNIVDERAELKATLAEWTSAVGKKKYLHGDHVTLPDLLVFGVLRSISGLSTFREIMADNADLSAWYGRVDLSLVSMAKTSK